MLKCERTTDVVILQQRKPSTLCFETSNDSSCTSPLLQADSSHTYHPSLTGQWEEIEACLFLIRYHYHGVIPLAMFSHHEMCTRYCTVAFELGFVELPPHRLKLTLCISPKWSLSGSHESHDLLARDVW